MWEDERERYRANRWHEFVCVMAGVIIVIGLVIASIVFLG